MDKSAIENLMPDAEGFPRPDWLAIQELANKLAPSDLHETWCEVARVWMSVLAESIGQQYRVLETDNFLILSCLENRELSLIAKFVETARSTILHKLQDIAADEYPGIHVLLIFGDEDKYYQYVSYYHPDEGDFPMSSGMFLNRDYGHMVIPYSDLYFTEATFAHEYTHCCLSHLPLPLWLNEGLAVTLENELCGSNPLSMDSKRLAEHEKFWNAQTIQEFWSGESFQRTDEGCSLSYELARYCIKALAHDLAEFTAFANLSSFEDGGESAALQVFEGSLGGLPYQFFGDGDWSPKPESWSAQ